MKIFVWFDKTKNKYCKEYIDSRKLQKILDELRIRNYKTEVYVFDTDYDMYDEDFMMKLNINTYLLENFRGILGLKYLFDLVQEDLQILKRDIHSDILYHHTISTNIEELITNGLRCNVGEFYRGYYQDLLNYEYNFDELLSDIPKSHFKFVPCIFLSTENDYNITDDEDELIIEIDKKLITNKIYRDFNESRNDCIIVTEDISSEAILRIYNVDEDGEIIETFYSK